MVDQEEFPVALLDHIKAGVDHGGQLSPALAHSRRKFRVFSCHIFDGHGGSSNRLARLLWLLNGDCWRDRRSIVNLWGCFWGGIVNRIVNRLRR